MTDLFSTSGARDDRANGSTNTWTAPETPGEVVLVVVLRDDRGGVGWRRVRATVE